MPKPKRTIVLKFGGSVLLDEHRLRIAVHEIYRWRRESWRVVAVVSALAGRTEELSTQCDELCPNSSDHVRGCLLGLGERESATLLGIHLDRAGIPARVLTPGAVELRAHGPALDAQPESVNCTRINDALDTDGVVVFPGFVALTESGESVTLGRGGSDLSAVFLAKQLRADCCRLIKDVDGLYESDPAATDIAPARYHYSSYEDALATDGSIIQHKAVQFAQSHGIEFELGRFNGTRPTTIGPAESVLNENADSPKKLSVGLCGCGTVGGGVLELIEQLPDLFEVTGIARRNPERCCERDDVVITDNATEAARFGADVIIETIGGCDVALDVATSAIASRAEFITANKALIAEYGTDLQILASHHNNEIRASASVGGIVPVLEALDDDSIVSVKGILNGTGNAVLGSLQTGIGLNEAVLDAQAKGFAEADPSRDLDGRDALDKLCVIAQKLGWSINTEDSLGQSLTDWAHQDDPSYPARQIAKLSAGGVSVGVEPVATSSDYAKTQNEWNIVELEHDDGSITTLRGKGAGRWPTSEAVFADLLEVSRVKSAQSLEVCHA